MIAEEIPLQICWRESSLLEIGGQTPISHGQVVTDFSRYFFALELMWGRPVPGRPPRLRQTIHVSNYCKVDHASTVSGSSRERVMSVEGISGCYRC